MEVELSTFASVKASIGAIVNLQRRAEEIFEQTTGIPVIVGPDDIAEAAGKRLFKEGGKAGAEQFTKAATKQVDDVAKGTKEAAQQTAKNVEEVENLLKAQQRAVHSLQQRVAEHQKKLADFVKNPDAFDNKGLLKNAPSPEIRQKIIEGRVRHLQTEIKAFQDQINKILGGA